MNTPDNRWQRLAAAARQIRDERDTAAPAGFATRVAAHAFARVEQPFSAILARFSWRALGFAALLALVSVWPPTTRLSLLSSPVRMTILLRTKSSKRLSTSPEPMDRSFLAGLFCGRSSSPGSSPAGSFSWRWPGKKQSGAVAKKRPAAVVVPLGPIVVRQMINQLDLNRDQRKAVSKVLLESGTVVRVLRSETDIALDRMQDDIDKILTPDQLAKLGKLKDDQRVRVMEQREKSPPFPPTTS